ncbi:hypothetical protein F0562_015976 [Nyssa sinensis]|uniref:Uncharacterized protein n=1 Tax=Nyssa sinensis TaxID=561372 RepID=A0A5J4ZLT4_9ASTE|nr:hypothetical protein F0562_015944 [Nyssa sinensis]KAA8518502.1 hypothetical protein F0562_015976 [Nyssa sinensis]
MSSGLGKVATVLTAVFVVLLVALVADLFYVLWRRRVFRRRNDAVHGGDVSEIYSDTFSTSSKELLYFFCWKYRSRIEPDRAPVRGPDGSAPSAPPEVIDVFKLQGMYGPSRVLFTIKEEEREELESEKSLSSAEKVPMKTKRVSLEECFTEVAGDLLEVEVTIDVDGKTTPFSTPCASPLYYTPTASPSREEESVAVVSGPLLYVKYGQC